MTHGKTYNKSPRRINHKATKSKTNTGTTALERSVEQTTGEFKALLQLANFTLGPDATLNTEIHKNSVRIKAPNSVNASKRKHKNQINHYNKHKQHVVVNMLFQKVIYGNIVNKVINGNIVNMMLKIIEHPIHNNRKDMKKFFDALKTLYGLQSSGTTPLLSADGTSLLTDKEAILKRWAGHFDDVFIICQ